MNFVKSEKSSRYTFANSERRQRKRKFVEENLQSVLREVKFSLPRKLERSLRDTRESLLPAAGWPFRGDRVYRELINGDVPSTYVTLRHEDLITYAVAYDQWDRR